MPTAHYHVATDGGIDLHIDGQPTRRVLDPIRPNYAAQPIAAALTGAYQLGQTHGSCQWRELSPLLLRAGARRLRQHPAVIGYNISAALFAAALELVDRPHAQQAQQHAHQVFAEYLQRACTGSVPGDQLVCRLGMLVDVDNIVMQMHAAAADHEGITFDPDAFDANAD